MYIPIVIHRIKGETKGEQYIDVHVYSICHSRHLLQVVVSTSLSLIWESRVLKKITTGECQKEGNSLNRRIVRHYSFSFAS